MWGSNHRRDGERHGSGQWPSLPLKGNQMTKPSPIALVVCDNIYQERTGKSALVGLFNRMTAEKFPVKHARMCVYASVTDVRPNTTFKLVVVHSETDRQVVSLHGPPPERTDPTTICDFNFELNSLVFEEPGRYYIQLWGNEHLLLQRPFEVQAAGADSDRRS